MTYSQASSRSFRVCCAGLLLSAAAFLAGCGGMIGTAGPITSLAAAGVLSGHIHGGNQPVANAVVTLYSVGAAGYGSAATQFATTKTLADGTGNFTFSQDPAGTTETGTSSTFSCPSSGNPQMYLTSIGGNTQGTGNAANSAAGFIAALGTCSSLGGQSVVLNEAITVGTLAALQQYFNPATEALGYPSSTQGTQGYVNALTTIPNLVSLSGGIAQGSTTLTATPAGATGVVTVTVTPEQSKINTIANIAAACVNTTSNTSTNCNTLFNNAYPPTPANTSQPSITMAKATDTLQAIYYMLTNPASESTAGTNNATAITNLFALAPASSPFQPTLAKAPTDWTIGVRYYSGSACTYGTFLTASYFLEADATGNIWIASGGGSSTTSNLIELTPNGTPATCALGSSVAAAKSLTIDTGGNVWIAGNTAGVPFYKYNPGTATATSFATTNATAVPYAIAADGSGNVFYTDTGNNVVSEFVGAATATSATPVNIASVAGYSYFMAIDTAGVVYVPVSSNSNPSTSIYDIYPSTGTGNMNGYIGVDVGNTTNVINPYAIAAGLSGRMYLANSATTNNTAAQTAYYLTQSSGTATYSSNTAQDAGGIYGPRGPNAIDGAGNVWYANATAPSGTYISGGASGSSSISELTSALVPLSPTGTTGGFQKTTTIYNTAPRALAIDPSGNVWGGSNSAAGNGVFEIVGAAVPVVTPISGALSTAIAAGSNNAVSKP